MTRLQAVVPKGQTPASSGPAEVRRDELPSVCLGPDSVVSWLAANHDSLLWPAAGPELEVDLVTLASSPLQLLQRLRFVLVPLQLWPLQGRHRMPCGLFHVSCSWICLDTPPLDGGPSKGCIGVPSWLCICPVRRVCHICSGCSSCRSPLHVDSPRRYLSCPSGSDPHQHSPASTLWLSLSSSEAKTLGHQVHVAAPVCVSQGTGWRACEVPWPSTHGPCRPFHNKRTRVPLR